MLPNSDDIWGFVISVTTDSSNTLVIIQCNNSLMLVCKCGTDELPKLEEAGEKHVTMLIGLTLNHVSRSSGLVLVEPQSNDTACP